MSFDNDKTPKKNISINEEIKPILINGMDLKMFLLIDIIMLKIEKTADSVIVKV
jgi:hypothetical protein